jgi:CubicO group peptidase (beta-lactamase class C family)
MNRAQAFILAVLLPIFVPTLAKGDKIDTYIRTEIKKRQIPGLSLAVIKNGRVIKKRAYGRASVELNVPVTSNTVYQLWSLTKVFTGTAVMALVEEGKLSLEDRVGQLLPGLPPAWGEVTVRHLLTHTSGLPNIPTDSRTGALLAETRDEAMKQLTALPLLAKPGKKWNHTHTNSALLGDGHRKSIWRVL